MLGLSKLQTAALGATAALAVALAGVALWYRAEAVEADRDRREAEASLETAVNANRNLTASLANATKARLQNDALLVRLNQELSRLENRTIETRTIIEREAANDPAVASWLDTPIPNGVRDALNSD